MKQHFQHYLLLHIIVILWGFTGIVGKMIHLDCMQIVWHRLWIALFGLSVFAFLFKKTIRISTFSQGLVLMGGGVVIAAHWITFFKAIQLSTASLGILCLATITIHVTWLEPIITKKKFSPFEFIVGIIVLLGIGISSYDFKENEFSSLAFGLVSALLAALFSVLNGRLAKTMAVTTMAFYELLSGFLFLSIYLYFQGQMNSSLLVMRGIDFVLLLFLGLACTTFAFIMAIRIIEVLGPFTVALAVNLEPIYTILFAILILKENKILSLSFYGGAVFIVVILFLNPFIKKYFRCS